MIKMWNIDLSKKKKKCGILREREREREREKQGKGTNLHEDCFDKPPRKSGDVCSNNFEL